MTLLVSCEPPLGQATVVQEEKVEFSASLQAGSSGNLEVVVWHDGRDAGIWSELYLARVRRASQNCTAKLTSRAEKSRH